MEKLLPMLIPIPIKIKNRFTRSECNKIFKENGTEIWKMYTQQRYANGNLGLLANFLSNKDRKAYYNWIGTMNLINIDKLKALVATM